MKVAVAIATYRRPGMLAELLDSLGRLEARTAEVEVVVVDNDAAGSAREVVDGAGLPFPVTFDVEPERNISLARNRAVRMALGRGADFVAFVDDDETVPAGWLEELLRVQRQTGADAVMGGVLPRFDGAVPAWIVRGRFFEQMADAPPGAPLPVASTNNVLVAAHLLADPAGPFDPRFGISGGGDSLFFTRAHRGGARLVWAPGATVYELIPATRARLGWLLRRAYRVGNGAVWCERALEPPLRRVGARAAKAAARLALGAALLLPSLLGGRAAAVRALRNASYGAGALAALAGHRYHEYRGVHGR